MKTIVEITEPKNRVEELAQEFLQLEDGDVEIAIERVKFVIKYIPNVELMLRGFGETHGMRDVLTHLEELKTTAEADNENNN